MRDGNVQSVGVVVADVFPVHRTRAQGDAPVGYELFQFERRQLPGVGRHHGGDVGQTLLQAHENEPEGDLLIDRPQRQGVGIQVFIGGEHETRSIHNMTKLVDAGLRYGMPVMGVTAVGTNMVRDAKYFRLACRIIAELGAQYVKTYFVADGFETVTASCPVPIVMAGGKKLPELEALTMAYNAVQQGAAGVDMGRNIFQSDAPKAMIAAVHAVVHQNLKPKEALEMYQSLKAKG